MTPPELAQLAVVGRPQPRVDGPLKVTGVARYASDHLLPGLLYAVPVCSTIAQGELERLDTAAAEGMPGVRAVLHRRNLPPLRRASLNLGFGSDSSYFDEHRPPLEDDVIRHFGQYLGLVVADTFEQATAGAQAVKATYRGERPPNVDPRLGPEHLSPPGCGERLDVRPQGAALARLDVESERGDPDAAFAASAVQVDRVYVVPPETHNPMELHATVAAWEGASVTLYESTQGVVNHRNVLAQVLGLPRENVRVITRFLGGGFGSKLWSWPHSALAAAAARQLGRPVKLVLTRRLMFATVGHRPRTAQRIRLGATQDGRLTSLHQDWVNHTSILDDYKEDCGEVTPQLYGAPNLRVTSALARRNVGTPCPMRGPGAVPGVYATESAMDELACALGMDPVQLRILNEPPFDLSRKVPFSSRHLVECLTAGAVRFGWSRRDAAIGSMRRDGLALGWGVACCAWAAERFGCDARLDLRDDGTACVAVATQDIGTGTYTVLAQLAAESLGLPLGKVEVLLGDTVLPPGPISGGSMTTASVVPAVLEAARRVVASLLVTVTRAHGSPFYGRRSSELACAAGKVHARTDDPASGIAFDELLRACRVGAVTSSGSASGTSSTEENVSRRSYGAHFVEVTWEAALARLRVSRVVSVIDAGRIINPLAARSQVQGAVVMGIGMALLEETLYDPVTGAPINSNLAEYMVPTNADVPPIEVMFLDHPDPHVDELGARGVGEIGLAGVAPAIASAVHHATGVRVRELPIRLEHLLGS